MKEIEKEYRRGRNRDKGMKLIKERNKEEGQRLRSKRNHPPLFQQAFYTSVTTIHEIGIQIPGSTLLQMQ
jgi:hypothetical protein